MTAAAPWPFEALERSLQGALPGCRVEVVASIDSTNSELMRRARAGDTAPVLLVAREQTAGRGRLGRDWHALPDQALTFSLGLPFEPADWSGLSLAVGLALAEALHPAVRLKWPNDLWWQHRKLGGILVETAGGSGTARRQVVIGIGLNLALPPAQGLATPPAALHELLPGLTAPEALARLAPALAAALRAFQSGGFAPLVERFAARDALAGQKVRLSDATEGVACGVAPDGALRLQTDGGERRVHSSEVSIRCLDSAVETSVTQPGVR